MQSWDSYCADPRNRTQVTLSVRLLADTNISPIGKVIAAYMSLRPFDVNDVQTFLDFFKDAFTTEEIFDGLVELYTYGYTTLEADEAGNIFVMKLKPCALCMPWSEK